MTLTMTREINQLLDWTPNAALADAPTVSAGDHKHGMRNVGASVFIVTTRDGGSRFGLTATAVCSVTADPPRLVVFVNKSVAADAAILNSGGLCVNVLAGDQEEIAKVFAGMVEGVRGETRFDHGAWDVLATGSPVLAGALASFDCRVVKVFDESTHHAFLCEVLATRGRGEDEGGGQALIYLNGAFRRIDP